MEDPQAPTDPSSCSSSLERRPSADEAMTIEFLRARLLSERSVSKAARQRAQQLSEKISELEERLEAEIQLRRKLEADRLEILSKYRAELSEEYGEFFASSFGEGLSRNESHAPNGTEHLDRGDSSQRLNHEEANDEDEETDQSGREKGVLSWGRPKGSRREFGHGSDWLGRSLSQRSLASTDGESPQKKWAGKSVRQIRKRESRPFSSNLEGDPGQSQVSEDFDGKSGQPDDVKERLQCEDERDTEVERVLERQAELIEQFEAEENAQRAWEAKFKEAKALVSHETGITQSNSSSDLETVTKNMEFESLAKDAAIETESTVHEDATRYSRKVHPEDCPSNSEEIQDGLVQSERVASEYTSGIESEKNKIVPTAAVDKEACSSTNQNKIGSTASREHILLEGKSGVVECTKKVESRNERLTEIDPPDEDGRLYSGESSCREGLSQDKVLSNMDTEQSIEHSKAPALELGKSSKYKKHLSSSFRFNVFADAEPVTSSSPQMPGFAAHKRDTDKVEEGEVGKEELLLNGSTAASEQMSGFGLSEPRHDEQHYPIAATTTLDHHSSVEHPFVSEDHTFSTKDTESQEKSKDILHEATRQQENENGVMNHLSNHEVGNDLISDSNREEILKRTFGLGRGQDLSRHYSDFPSYPEFRGPGVGLQPGLGRPHSDFPSHLHSSMQQLQLTQEKSKEILHESTRQQENLAALMNHLSNHELGNDLISDLNREEILKRTLGSGGGEDQGRHYSDFPSYPEFRGPGVGLQPGSGRHHSDFPSHLHSGVQQLQIASMKSDGASFGNLASLPGNRSGVPGPVLNANVYEDTAFRSQRRSVDGGFDRVADVLRALQMARYQIESSGEQATPFAIDTPYRNGYDGRDEYYVEPPRLPSVYVAPPQYTSPVPYSSRGVPPFSQNMQGWGYGAGSSRQLANAAYMHYASRVPEPQSLWPPPPSQGVHNGNLYHYDTRQHR